MEVDSFAVLYVREKGSEDNAVVIPITSLPFSFKRGEIDLDNAAEEAELDAQEEAGLFCGKAKQIRLFRSSSSSSYPTNVSFFS